MRLDYAQFLELEMFTRFGGVTDAQIKDKIARGQRIRAILSQHQYAHCGSWTKSRLCSHCSAAFSTVCRWRYRKVPLRASGLARPLGWQPIVDEIERTGRLDDAKSAELKASALGAGERSCAADRNVEPRTK